MDRKKLQDLAEARLEDAKALLEAKKWAGAYYLCGYAVESALKACILRHLGESDAVFGDPDYLKKLSKSWTHNLVDLFELAGLVPEFGAARGLNAALDAYWNTAKDWKETSRYVNKTENEARSLYEAVCQKPDGVLPWIQSRW